MLNKLANDHWTVIDVIARLGIYCGDPVRSPPYSTRMRRVPGVDGAVAV